MAVEKRRKSSYFKPRQQLVRELGRILARIGDEDLKLFADARVSHRLLDHIAVCFPEPTRPDQQTTGPPAAKFRRSKKVFRPLSRRTESIVFAWRPSARE